MDADNLILFGSSTRAAAFSALRAGLRPWCADLFADADLQARCPAMRLPGAYPHGFLDWIGADIPGPWMYTGGLENRPWLVERLARRRPLWGNDCPVLLQARDPAVVAAAVRAAGLPAPAVYPLLRRPPPGRWLVKPQWGLGRPIHGWTAADAVARPSLLYYVQEFIEGESEAAIFCGDGKRAVLLGLTRQLVGLDWLHAAPFRYCGSIGPLRLDSARRRRLETLGDALARRCRLRGLFGVDGIVRDGAFLPVEVNPRYTASVEVLEYGCEFSALAWHRAAFVSTAPRPAPPTLTLLHPRGEGREGGACIGKAVLFAKKTLTFPPDGPWNAVLQSPSPAGPPSFADIPHLGTVIKMGRPILSFFASGENADACLDALRRIAAELDRLLFP
ncbi:MAG TPA: ATP-grasp domain-containing protein [Gemmataceae bacterium]|nr:ATP-grasp domain-containing protein [Gemmataceae bacterium]